jgi:hypothetical protein
MDLWNRNGGTKIFESTQMRLLPPYTRGSSSNTIFGIDVYGQHHEQKWFKPFLAYYDFLQKIDSIYYWIRYRTFDKYHVVKTDLKPGYCDIDERMFRACFALLGQFVELELGIENVEHALKYGHHRGYRIHSLGGSDEKAIDLWLWYKFEMEKNPNEEERNQKLLELMQIRRNLWT